MLDMIGIVYSPEIILESGLKDDIESLGLGHLNMIYMALKIM